MSWYSPQMLRNLLPLRACFRIPPNTWASRESRLRVVQYNSSAWTRTEIVSSSGWSSSYSSVRQSQQRWVHAVLWKNIVTWQYETHNARIREILLSRIYWNFPRAVITGAIHTVNLIRTMQIWPQDKCRILIVHLVQQPRQQQLSKNHRKVIPTGTKKI